MKLDVINLDGSKAGDIELNADLFGLEPRADILHRVVRWQRNNAQAGTHEGFLNASRNIEGLDILPTMGANVYDILKRDTLVITKAGIEALEARLK